VQENLLYTYIRNLLDKQTINIHVQCFKCVEFVYGKEGAFFLSKNIEERVDKVVWHQVWVKLHDLRYFYNHDFEEELYLE